MVPGERHGDSCTRGRLSQTTPIIKQWETRMAAHGKSAAGLPTGLGARVLGVVLSPVWPWTLDANGDGIITFPDVTSWFFYPGDLCLYWLMTLRTPQAVQLRQQLGITSNMYHGPFSIVVSFASWAVALMLLWGITDFVRSFLRSIFFGGRRRAARHRARWLRGSGR